MRAAIILIAMGLTLAGCAGSMPVSSGLPSWWPTALGGPSPTPAPKAKARAPKKVAPKPAPVTPPPVQKAQ